MSFQYYINWWIKSRRHLEDLYAKDEKVRSKAKTFDKRWLANDLVGGLYAKYCMLVQELDNCLDQLAQPQKKAAVRKLVSAAIMRLLEFNDELREIDISEYHYIDGQLVELKLVPYSVEVLHPLSSFPRPFDIQDLVDKYKNNEKLWEPPEPEPEEEVAAEEQPQEQSPDQETETKKSGSKLVEIRKSLSKVAQKTVSQKIDTDGSAQDVARKNTKSKIAVVKPVPVLPPPVEDKSSKYYVKLIQTAERGRQTRIYFMELESQRRRKTPSGPGGAAVPKPDPEVHNKAATTIQKITRGWQSREWLKFKELQRRFCIGMYEPSWKSREQHEIFEANIEKRRKYRDQRMRDYIDAIDQEKARVLRVVGPGLLEDIEDEIREWFRVWYKEAKCFDTYPPDSKGGTILVVRGETMTPKEFIDDVEKKRREKARKGNIDKAKEKQKQKLEKEKRKKEEAEKKKKLAEKKKKEELAKKRKKRKGEFEFEFRPTKTKDLYESAEQDLVEFWDERNDFDNPTEKHYMDIITEKECYLLQLEIRKQADELMRIELDLLNQALLMDKGKKPKKGKKGKGKKKKGKKGKGKRKKKDMTSSRTTEDLFQELLDNGIIRTYPKTYMDSFFGDFSYKNTELRYKDEDPPAAMLDIRQAVILNCILPLIVESMKRPRSVLIAGPNKCGKHVLANAIFTRTQCVLFDLSPEVTAGKYPGKKGMVMLLHLINKMARLLQPSIIFLDGAEKLFYKKVPKEEKEMDPKRLGKKLTKGIIKAIKPDDRILVVGITSAPWLGKSNMKKSFDRILLMPRPDYGSVYMYWKEILRPYHGVDRNFNITCLANMTKYFSYNLIKEVVETVLNPRRIIQLKYQPLRPEELFEVIVSNQIEGIPDKIWKKFLKWYYKTPLGRDRNLLNKITAKLKEKEAKANQRKR